MEASGRMERVKVECGGLRITSTSLTRQPQASAALSTERQQGFRFPVHQFGGPHCQGHPAPYNHTFSEVHLELLIHTALD